MGIKDLSGFISQGVAGGIIGQYISDIFFNLFVFDKKHFYDVITNVSPTPAYIAATTSGFLNGITSPYIDNISSLALRNVAYVYTNDFVRNKPETIVDIVIRINKKHELVIPIEVPVTLKPVNIGIQISDNYRLKAIMNNQYASSTSSLIDLFDAGEIKMSK